VDVSRSGFLGWITHRWPTDESPIHQKTCHVTYVCRSQIFCTTHLLKHTYPERVCPNAHGWQYRHACIDFGRQISDTSCLTQDYSHWADRMVIDLYTPFEFKAAEAWFCTTVPAICKGLSLMYRSIWPAAKIGWFIISVIHMVVQNRRLLISSWVPGSVMLLFWEFKVYNLVLIHLIFPKQ